MYISARVDYAVRAMLTLAASDGGPIRADDMAKAQELPVRFLQNILNDLVRAGLVASQRGSDGGYRLTRPARTITVGDVIRPLEGPLAEVRGERPDVMVYDGAARHLQDVWVAVRASLREVLDTVTLADIVSGHLPRPVTRLLARPGAWEPKPLG